MYLRVLQIVERTFIGVNSALGDFSKIGKDTFISMSSTVYGNIKDGSVVIGNKTNVYESGTKQNSLKKNIFLNNEKYFLYFKCR